MISHYNFENVKVTAFQQAKGDNRYCGDSFHVYETEDYFVCAIADGLGSGLFAMESSQAAISTLEQFHEEDVGKIMEKANHSMRGKRGACMAVFKIDFGKKEISYCGIGNINLVLYLQNGSIVRPISFSGYLSGKPQVYRVETIPWENHLHFLMYSDGFQFSTEKIDILANASSLEHAIFFMQQYAQTDLDDVTYLIGKMT